MADLLTAQFSTETAPRTSLGASGNTPQFGIIGGGVGQAGPVAAGKDWFTAGMGAPMDGLPEFLEKQFAPAIENFKTQQMWQGFTAARAGQAQAELDKEKPWYSQIFGPTNYEIGAITYEAQKRSLDAEAEIMQRMPELRQMAPDQVAGVFNQVTQNRMTGNPYADTILRKTFMERAAALMDTHTKERAAWQNQELQRLQLETGTAALQNYQVIFTQNARLGASEPNDPEAAKRMEDAAIPLFDALATPSTQTDESRWAYIKALVSNGTSKGYMAGVNKLLDMGLRDSLSIEQQMQLDAVIEQGRAAYRASLPVDDPLVRELSSWYSDYGNGFLSPAETVTRAKAINDAYQSRTGDSKPFLDVSDATKAATSAYNQLYERERQLAAKAAEDAEKAQDEAAKRQVEAQRIEGARTSWFTGKMGMDVATGLYKPEEAEQQVLAQFTQDPGQAIVAAVRNASAPVTPWVSNRLKEAIQQGFPVSSDEKWSPAFEQTFQLFNAMENTPMPTRDGGEELVSGQKAAALYYTPEQIAFFREYKHALASKMAPDAAFEFAQTRFDKRIPRGNGDLSKPETEALESAMRGGFLQRVFGTKVEFSGPLRQAAVAGFMEAKAAYPNKDAEFWAETAIQKARQDKVDVAGRFSWWRSEHQQPISAFERTVSPDVFAKALGDKISAKLREANVDPDSETLQSYVYRLPDRDGYPNIGIWALDPKTGNVLNYAFTKQEFEDFRNNELKRAQARKEIDQQFGTPRLTF